MRNPRKGNIDLAAAHVGQQPQELDECERRLTAQPKQSGVQYEAGNVEQWALERQSKTQESSQPGQLDTENGGPGRARLKSKDVALPHREPVSECLVSAFRVMSVDLRPQHGGQGVRTVASKSGTKRMRQENQKCWAEAQANGEDRLRNAEVTVSECGHRRFACHEDEQADGRQQDPIWEKRNAGHEPFVRMRHTELVPLTQTIQVSGAVKVTGACTATGSTFRLLWFCGCHSTPPLWWMQRNANGRPRPKIRQQERDRLAIRSCCPWCLEVQPAWIETGLPRAD